MNWDIDGIPFNVNFAKCCLVWILPYESALFAPIFWDWISLVLGGQQGSSMNVLNSKPPVYLETLLLYKSPLNPLGWPGQDISKFVNHGQLDEPFWILDGCYGVLCNIVTLDYYAKSGEISLLVLPVLKVNFEGHK
jgi:hypothetical protein